MGLIEQIKNDLLKARKSKNGLISDLLSVVVGDAEKLGMAKGKRDATDDEVISIVRKMIESNEFMYHKLTCLAGECEKSSDLLVEIRWLKQYLPIHLSKPRMFEILKQYEADTSRPFELKYIMTYFKDNYPNQYDGKELSAIVKEVLAK